MIGLIISWLLSKISNKDIFISMVVDYVCFVCMVFKLFCWILMWFVMVFLIFFCSVVMLLDIDVK